jgi:hypothetical protein
MNTVSNIASFAVRKTWNLFVFCMKQIAIGLGMMAAVFTLLGLLAYGGKSWMDNRAIANAAAEAVLEKEVDQFSAIGNPGMDRGTFSSYEIDRNTHTARFFLETKASKTAGKTAETVCGSAQADYTWTEIWTVEFHLANAKQADWRCRVGPR